MISGPAFVALQRQVAELTERVKELEAGLCGTVSPLMRIFKLTPTEAQLLVYMLKRSLVTRDGALLALWGNDRDEPQPRIVDAYILKLRRRLAPYGISIQTVRGGECGCWSMDAGSRTTLYDLLRKEGLEQP